MEKRERENIVAKVLSGLIFFRLDSKIYKIASPTPEETCLAEFLATEASQHLNFDQLLTRKEAVKKLSDLDIWTAKDEEDRKVSEKALEGFKINLFEQRLNSKSVASIRSRIAGINKLLSASYTKKNTLEHATLETFTESVRDQFIVGVCISEQNGKKVYDPQHFLSSNPRIMQTGLVHWQAEFSLVNSLREIARTDPWKNYWSAASEHNVFGKPTRELNLIQRSLSLYSKMYENSHSSPECPPDEVFEDDDMFDGWMLLERKNRDSARDKKAADKTLSQHTKGSEIFLVAENRQDADKIQSINEHGERMKLKTRESELKASDDLILEKDLTDVKMDLRNQLREKLTQRRGN